MPIARWKPRTSGEKVLLVRVETSPEDLRGMIAAEGILTARGGVSSHAALVARQMGKVCVCGASALHVDYATKTLTRRTARRFKEGDFLSIDGTSGRSLCGRIQNRAVGNHPGAGWKIADREGKPRRIRTSRN